MFLKFQLRANVWFILNIYFKSFKDEGIYDRSFSIVLGGQRGVSYSRRIDNIIMYTIVLTVLCEQLYSYVNEFMHRSGLYELIS